MYKIVYYIIYYLICYCTYHIVKAKYLVTVVSYNFDAGTDCRVLQSLPNDISVGEYFYQEICQIKRHSSLAGEESLLSRLLYRDSLPIL